MEKITVLDRPRLAVQEVATRRPGIQPRRGSPPSITAMLSGGIALILLWQVAVEMARVPPWLLPSPLAVARRAGIALADGTLMAHLVPTFVASVGGFFVALAAGTGSGYLVAHSRRLERWIAPYLAGLQSVPVIAIAPLLIVWTPNGLIRNILVAALVVFFPIFSGTVAGLRGIPRELREVGRVEGATRWQTIHLIEVPLALPTLFSGIRTSLAYATTGAVVAEFVGTRYGLGAMINVARGLLDIPLLFVAIMCLIGITVFFYVVLTVIERRTTAWRDV